MKKLLILFGIVVMMLSAGCAKEEEAESLILVEPVGEGEQVNGGGDEMPEEGTDTSQTEAAQNETEAAQKETGAPGKEAPKAEEGASAGEEAKAAETPKNEGSTGEGSTAQADPAKAAFGSVLEELYKTYTLPDGTNLGYDEITDISENRFAIYDIDRDGKDELIVLWTTTIMAGMAEIVYGFDSASGTVRVELWEYPMETFYDNGIVEVGLSHNHGLAGELDFWPYTLYRYDQDTDTYIAAAEVDAWSKEFREKDFNDKPFPDDIDADGDGVVYKITAEGNEKLMDQAEYEKWRDSFVGGAKKVEIPFQELTENLSLQ